MTLNEPQCFIGLGHHTGMHAPGDRLGLKEVLRAAHHALLAHGKGVQAIRAAAKAQPAIGFAPVGSVKMPATESPADIEAARQSMFALEGKNLWANTFWMDPVFFGRYPEEAWTNMADEMPEIHDGDMETISQPLDFFGFNTYSGTFVKTTPDGPRDVPFPDGHPITAFYWWVTPECMYWGPKFFYERYRLPIVVTENGMANVDWIALDGRVHDPQRIDYLHRHLLQLARAIDEGVDVRGYFVWTLMDNFEWAEGYKQRFGIVYVDYPTGRRVLKDSAYWYRDVIATNGAILSSSD
jgi:beta-glucosidase